MDVHSKKNSANISENISVNSVLANDQIQVQGQIQSHHQICNFIPKNLFSSVFFSTTYILGVFQGIAYFLYQH